MNVNTRMVAMKPSHLVDRLSKPCICRENHWRNLEHSKLFYDSVCTQNILYCLNQEIVLSSIINIQYKLYDKSNV